MKMKNPSNQISKYVARLALGLTVFAMFGGSGVIPAYAEDDYSTLTPPVSISMELNAIFPGSQVDLKWVKNAVSDDVMIIRSRNETVPVLTNGISYRVGGAAGTYGTIVYKGSGTSFFDKTVERDTPCFYFLFSVRNDNYSDALEAGGILPTDGTDGLGPQPELLYIGPTPDEFVRQMQQGSGELYDRVQEGGWINYISDREARQQGNLGFVVRWTDPSGVYVTNKTSAGAWAWNIYPENGRVSPNWCIYVKQYALGAELTNEYRMTKVAAFAKDRILAQSNSDEVVTNWVTSAFVMPEYNPTTEYYLMLSAEDNYQNSEIWPSCASQGGAIVDSGSGYQASSGYAMDCPYSSRSVTEGYLIRIDVRDDDSTPPTTPGTPTVNGWDACTVRWTNNWEFILQFTPSVDIKGPRDEVASGLAGYKVTTDYYDVASDSGTALTIQDDGSKSGFARGLYRFQNLLEGSYLFFLYAADSDNDRFGDVSTSEGVPFRIAYDITPPTLISGQGVTGELTQDPRAATVIWNANSANPGHRSDGVELSPWYSYRVTQQVKESSSTAVYPTAMLQEYAAAGSATLADVYEVDGDDNASLADISTGLFNVENLIFGETYQFTVQGIDTAGNVGPLPTAVEYRVPEFQVTQGLSRTTADLPAHYPANKPRTAAIYWLASRDANGAVWPDYDLLSWDSTSFNEREANVWRHVGTINSNWYVDDTALFREPGQMRFYRAAFKDQWDRTKQKYPTASAEVYALNNVRLGAGHNFVALHGIPYANTLRAIFGNDITHLPPTQVLPGDNTGIRIEFYAQTNRTSGTTGIQSTAQYWLDSSGTWRCFNDPGVDYTDKELSMNEIYRGFSIWLPSVDYWPAGPDGYRTTVTASKSETLPYLNWNPVVRVPENYSFMNNVIYGGSVQNPTYNIVSLNLPVATHPSKMNLIECGFVGARSVAMKGYADQIFTVDPMTGTLKSTSGIYYQGTGSTGTWRFIIGDGLVPSDYFKPNEVITIVSKNGGDSSWLWQPTVPYTSPNKWMSEKVSTLAEFK